MKGTARRDTIGDVPKKPRPTMSSVERAELEEARAILSRGEAVRLVVGRKVVLCSSLEEVRSAQLGHIPSTAVRLDGNEKCT